MAEFQRYQEAPAFNPRAIVESGQRVAQQGQQIVEALQTYQGQVVQRDQNLVEDSARNNNADVLRSLGNLSQTASKTVETIEKQNAKNREIDSQYQALYNPELSPEEQAIYETAVGQQVTAGAAANELEAEGNELGAEALRNDLNRVGQGVADEKAKLFAARQNFAGDVLQIIDGNEELSRMMATDPGRALEIATKIFIEQNNLQYTTKNAFVGILGGTIRNFIQNTTTQQATAIIKERKDERLAENDAQSAAYASDFLQRDSSGNTVVFQELSQQYLDDNNGILTQGAANRRAANSLLSQAANSGNVDLVAAIGRTRVIPGDNTPTIAGTYPIEYTEALENAEKTRINKIGARRAQIFADMGEQLAGAQTAEERNAILNNGINELGDDWQGRLQLEQRYSSLVADPDKAATYQQHSDAIAGGQAYSPEYIDELRSNNRITTEQATKLKSQSRQLVNRTMELGKPDVQAAKGRFDNNLTRVTGLTIDPSTSTIIDTKDVTPITGKEARNISAAYARDQNIYIRTRVENMNVGEMSLKERADVVRDLADQFYKEQTQDPNGKYYLGGAFMQSGKVEPGSDEFEAIRIDAQLFGTPVEPRPVGGVQNWSNQWSPQLGTGAIKGEYQPGDILYSLQETKVLADQVNNSGIDPQTAAIAQQLGVTPLQLVQDSASSYNIPVNPINDGGVGKVVQPRSGWKPYRKDSQPVYAKLIPILLTHGYTPQGAAALVAALRIKTVLNYKGGDKNAKINTDLNTSKTGLNPLENVVTKLTGLGDAYPIFSKVGATPRQLNRVMIEQGLHPHDYANEINTLLTLAGYNQL